MRVIGVVERVRSWSLSAKLPFNIFEQQERTKDMK